MEEKFNFNSLLSNKPENIRNSLVKILVYSCFKINRDKEGETHNFVE